ncbi:hypothetical protein [uncultured Roseobacter sp.]|uniref:hypothetical protein n=1 Tax=uncultured Roseobacter sp. TaxID=114847 RepID=UPI00262CE1E4|nr:hypothetical protein [uncultured Roseobacter sp.]
MTALLCSCAAMAGAQQGGLQATLDVSQSLDWDDNPDLVATGGEGELIARTGLTFGLSSVTARDRLRLSLGTQLEFGDRDALDNNTGLNDPNLGLFYDRSARNAAFDFGLTYRESEVSDSIIQDELTDQDLIIDNGTRADTRLNFGLDLGTDAPFGISLSGFVRNREFSNTTNPDLFDVDDQGAEVTARFRIDPRITATLGANWRDFDAEGEQTDRLTTGFDAGLQLAVNRRLDVGITLGSDRVEIDEFVSGVPVRRVESGTSLGLSADLDMTNGALTADLQSDIEENGRRTTLRFGRSIALPGGDLSLSAGLVESESQDLAPLFGVNYSHELPRGSLALAFRQDPGTSTDSEEVVNTRLSVNYSETINSVSSWNAGLSLRDVNFLNDALSEDSRRIDLNATYRRDLTRDWDIVSGVRHSRVISDDEADRSSNSLFVSIERRFSFRP